MGSPNSSGPGSCSAAAIRRKPSTASSTRWCRRRPMRTCSRAAGRYCIGALPRPCAIGSRQWPKASLRSSPIISRRRGSAKLLSSGGSRRGAGAWAAPANNEAIAHLEKAIRLAEGLADGRAQRLLRLRLQTTYGHALLHGRGHSQPETIAAFALARQLAAGIEDAVARFSAYYGMGEGRLVPAG